MDYYKKNGEFFYGSTLWNLKIPIIWAHLHFIIICSFLGFFLCCKLILGRLSSHCGPPELKPLDGKVRSIATDLLFPFTWAFQKLQKDPMSLCSDSSKDGLISVEFSWPKNLCFQKDFCLRAKGIESFKDRHVSHADFYINCNHRQLSNYSTIRTFEAKNRSFGPSTEVQQADVVVPVSRSSNSFFWNLGRRLSTVVNYIDIHSSNHISDLPLPRIPDPYLRPANLEFLHSLSSLFYYDIGLHALHPTASHILNYLPTILRICATTSCLRLGKNGYLLSTLSWNYQTGTMAIS